MNLNQIKMNNTQPTTPKILAIALMVTALFAFSNAQATEDNNCYEIVFPVNYILTDGTAFEIQTKAVLDQKEAEWTAHGHAENTHLVYPIQIKWDGNAAKTINNVEEMNAEKANCN